MKNSALALTLFLSLVSFQALAAEKKSYITMNFPEAVIADALQRVVPLTFDGISSRMEGTITVISISKLRLLKQKISCHLSLVGNNLNLITKVANQDIRLKLGSARVDFDCDAQIRFDPKQNTLYIRPIARDLKGGDALKNGDIGQALLLLLNGREFGIAMQDIQPLITEASNKVITIQTKIADVSSINGALRMHLDPVVAARPK